MKIMLLRMKIEANVPLPDAPLGILYLASTLEKAGYDVIVKDLTYDKITDYEWSMIEKKEIGFVGISMLSFLRNQAYDIIRKIKQLNPEVKIAVGGVHASAISLQLVDNLPIDAAVIGEGEITILELVKNVNSDWNQIKGIATRETRIHPARDLIRNLDTISFPAFDKIDITKYTMSIASLKPDKTVNGVRIGSANWVGMIASRGCVGRCTFCSAFEHWKYKVRFRSPENILDEIEWLQNEFGVELIAFNDDAFPLSREQCKRFCEGILKRGIKIAWQTTTRASTVDEELCNLMALSGCFMIAVGCESGSQKILDSINKFSTVQENIDTLKMIHNSGIWSYALLMVGNPGESDETIKETIDFLQKAQPSIVSYVSGVMICPGTKLFELSKQKGIINDDFWISGVDGLPYYTAENSYNRMLEWGSKIGAAYPIDFDKLK